MNGLSPLSNITKRLEGKVAIITGGASGIGAVTAKLFLEHGAKVIIADVQDELGGSLCRDHEDSNIHYVHCDVTSDSDVENVVNFAISKYGKLDIMYNNAGISGNAHGLNILGAGNEDFKRVFEVNVYGAFLGSKHAARVMIPAKKGVIIFTSSAASVCSGVAPHAYTVSKMAVVGLMKNLCVELGQHGIRVNSISPSAVDTPLFRGALGFDKITAEEVLGTSLVLKGVVPAAEDMAEAVVFLSSDESKFVSGVNLVIDGGYSITNPSFSMLIKGVISKRSGTNV